MENRIPISHLAKAGATINLPIKFYEKIPRFGSNSIGTDLWQGQLSQKQTEQVPVAVFLFTIYRLAMINQSEVSRLNFILSTLFIPTFDITTKLVIITI